MPVHLFGNPADNGEHEKIARKYNLVLIEDACQAHGAEFKAGK
jgi:dTDP-4-amino-4,6-dideoxygalactose transaminase